MDLDQSGTNFESVDVTYGPTLGRIRTQVVPSQVPPTGTVAGGAGGGGGGGGGGGSFAGSVPVFATPADAQQASIATGTKFVAVQGNRIPGDGGAATFGRVNSLQSLYAGDGTTISTVPPSFTSGGVPTLCFATTTANQSTIGPTSAPINAGCLTIVTVWGWATFTSTVIDSVGNIYSLAANNGGNTLVYYCSNPAFAPIGTTFNIPGDGARFANVYCFSTFTGAVLDQIANSFDASNIARTGATITSPALNTSPELAFAIVFAGASPVNTTPGPNYTVPVGWVDIEPPINFRNPVACTVVNSNSPVTFNPTWPVFNSILGMVLVTFKTFPTPSLNAGFWSLMPTLPLHTAQAGIDPATPDNLLPFRNFSNYLGTIAAPSGGVLGQARAGTDAGTVTISIGNPAVITSHPPFHTGQNQNITLRNGQAISFSTTGQLPTGIVPGQIYYIQYGTVTPNSFQISATSLFNANSFGGQRTVAKGTPIATTGTQSGVHSYTTYGESWTDIVLDPGVYYASNNQVPGVGAGLQKWRLFGYGARLATNAYFFGDPEFDVNANTGGSTFAYTAQFQTTINTDLNGQFNNSVTLTTPAQAVNFYVNSWVILMCIEMLGGSDGNWNQAIFEYVRIKSIDYGAGIIGFWDTIQYNYRSTYPKFLSTSNATTGASVGPATIVQMSDVFDQEIEVHGLNMYGVTEETCGGVVSLRFVDCDIWGWGFDSGPAQVFVRRFIMENCRFHNYVPEVDKMIDTMIYKDCDFDMHSYLRLQSASINKVVIDRCKMMGPMSGTGKDLTIRDSYIAGVFTLAPVYGSTSRMTWVNSHIQGLANNAQSTEVLIIGIAGVTFVNGTIKIASGTNTVYGTWSPTIVSAACPAPWAQPGARVEIVAFATISTGGFVSPVDGLCGMLSCFTVLDVYTDGAGAFCIDTNMAALPNTAITVTGTVSGTTLTVTAISPANAYLLEGANISGGTLPAGTTVTVDNGGMPGPNTGTFTLSNSATIGTSTNFTASLKLNYLPHLCPRMTVINCTGGRFVADWAGAPPDIPIFSYFRRAFSGSTLLVNTSERQLFLTGNLLTLTINVLKPYTGAGATYVCQFHVGGFATSGGITYPTYITQSIDLKTIGLRTITAAGISGNVGADAIAAIPFWISGSHYVRIGTPPLFNPTGGDTLANMPFFIMTAQTDQGVDFSSMVTVTTTSGADQFADTTTGV